jgi:nuclear pore complex protein Nup160
VAVVDQPPPHGDGNVVVDGHICYLITFSPMDDGEFKFWAVSEARSSSSGAGGVEMRDLYPNERFCPPPPLSDLWVQAHFRLVPVAASTDDGQMELWTLWKNNTSYRVQMLALDVLNAADDWRKPWTLMAMETLRDSQLPLNTPNQHPDPTHKWMQHIFYPGRFPKSTISTALSIYRRSLHLPSAAAAATTAAAAADNEAGSQSLEERVCACVASSSILGRSADADADTDMDFGRFNLDTESQWRRLYRIIAELDKQRGEAISFAYDQHARMAWVLNADGVAAIRNCSDMEIVWHNRGSLVVTTSNATNEHGNNHNHEAAGAWPGSISGSGGRGGRISGNLGLGLLDARYVSDADRIAGLITAAANFRAGFSDHLLQLCATALQREIATAGSGSGLEAPVPTSSFSPSSSSSSLPPASSWRDGSAVAQRISAFYEHCDFGGLVDNEKYDALMDAINGMGGARVLDTDVFESVVDILAASKPAPTADLALTRFGERVVVAGAQEMIHLNGTVLADLLYLLVFLDVEGKVAMADAMETEDDDANDSGDDGGGGNNSPLAVDTASVYVTLLRHLRAYAVLGWMVTTTRLETPVADHHRTHHHNQRHNQRHDRQAAAPAPVPAQEAPRVSTVLQFPWVRTWKPVSVLQHHHDRVSSLSSPSSPMPAMRFALTRYISQVLAGIGLADPEEYEQQVMWLQRTFIRRGDVGLAVQFARFQPVSSWASYIAARLHLCLKEYAEAAALFRKAAFNLCKIFFFFLFPIPLSTRICSLFIN